MEEYYKNLILFLPDIVYQLDNKGHFIYINDSVEKLGYSPDQLIGVHFSEIIEPADASSPIDYEDLIKAHLKETPRFVNERRTGKRVTKHLNILLKPKKEDSHQPKKIEAELFSTGYYGNGQSGKKYSGTIGIIREKGPRDTSDKTLLQVERYYRLLSDNSSEIIIIAAHDGTILSVSDSAKKNLGIEPFDLIGENMDDAVHPDDLLLLKGIFAGRVEVKGKGRRIGFRLKDSNGNWCSFETAVSSVLDEKDGGIVCWIFNAIDVTKRKATERAQERRERIYKTLLRLSPDAIVLFDKEGDIIMANDRAALIAGLPREEIIGTHFLSIITEENHHIAEHMRDQLLQRGTAVDWSIDLRRPDGSTIPLEVNMSTIEDAQNQHEGYLAVFRDVTSKRKAEDEKKKIENDLLQIIVNRLSDREVELLSILAQGYVWPEGKKDIGRIMNALPGTLDQFVYRIRRKMEMTDMERIVKIVALRYGWVLKDKIK